MHHPLLNKYLLIAAIALTVLVFDAYIGPSRQQLPATSNTSTAPQPSANSNARPAADPLHTSLQLQLPSKLSAHVTAAPATHALATSPENENLAQKLHTIESDYRAVSQPILEKSPPIIEPDDRVRLAYLDREKLADLGEMLSPAELEVYQNLADAASAPQRR